MNTRMHALIFILMLVASITTSVVVVYLLFFTDAGQKTPGLIIVLAIMIIPMWVLTVAQFDLTKPDRANKRKISGRRRKQ